jgi:signal transduction histidine kinase
MVAEIGVPAPRVAGRTAWLPDLVAAALVTAFLIVVTRQIPTDDGERSLDAFGYVLLILAGASMGLTRRRPAVALAVVSGALAAYVARDYVGGPIYLTGWVALFVLSWRTNRRTGLVGAAVLVGCLGVASLSVDNATPLVHLVYLGWSAAAVFLGDALRNRRNYLVELEGSREEEARRRVAEDRLRIARDLHDGVAHAMATINVHAGAAAHVVARRPEAAEHALAAIQRASADALDELNALVALLRDDGEVAERAPRPGLDDIADLVATTAETGLPVSLLVDGSFDDVPKPVGSAAYRIVQESLTNVIRHARSAPTTVAVHAEGRHLTVAISDDGVGGVAASPGAGMGIRGMRERAESTGGVFSAGPGGGGFTVRAEWNGGR